MVTQEQLRELFEYRDGHLIRRTNVSNVKAGDVAGTTNVKGYRVIYVDGRPYKAHRLVFLYHWGWLPKLVDHKDRNTLNNRIENLRPATNSQNSQNSTWPTKGVGQHNGRWRARITVNGKSKFLGHFGTEDEALAAYATAAEKLHGEYSCPSTKNAQ